MTQTGPRGNLAAYSIMAAVAIGGTTTAWAVALNRESCNTECAQAALIESLHEDTVLSDSDLEETEPVDTRPTVGDTNVIGTNSVMLVSASSDGSTAELEVRGDYRLLEIAELVQTGMDIDIVRPLETLPVCDSDNVCRLSVVFPAVDDSAERVTISARTDGAGGASWDLRTTT